MIPLVALAALAALAADPAATPPSAGDAAPLMTPRDVLAAFDHEPGVRAVQRWAVEHARLRPQTVDRWLTAARTFGAMPRVQVEYRFRDGWDQDFVYVKEGGAVVPELDDAGRNQDVWMIFRATWNLGDLLMSSERLRMIDEAQDVVKLRDKVLAEVTRLYFERRRLQVEMLLGPRGDLATRVRQELRLEELTALIDAATGGAYGRALPER